MEVHQASLRKPLPWLISATLVAALAAFSLRGGVVQPSPGAGVPPSLLKSGDPETQQSYGWRPIAVGGGGFITGMAFSRDGSAMLARSDVHGAYRWDAAQDRWQLLVTASSMPPTDRSVDAANAGVYEIAVAPSDPLRMMMALKGRLFRSDDGGAHWQRAGEHLFRFNANADGRLAGPFLAISPDDPDLMLFGTAEDGLWRSGDGGRHWAVVPSVPAARPLPGGAHRAGPGIVILFASEGSDRGAVYAASPGNGLFRSGDGGQTFVPTGADGARGPQTIWHAATMASGDLLAVDRDGQMAAMLHRGRWTSLTATGKLPAAAYVGVATEPASGLTMVVDQGGGTWCSANGGADWTAVGKSVSPGPADPPWLHVANQSYLATSAIAFDPAHRGVLWAATGTGPYRAETGGRCGALAWRSRVRGIEELVAMDVVQSPGNAPVLAALDFGIHVKPDLDRFSDSYGPVERVLIAAQQLATTPADPQFLVTNASDTRQGCCSEDGRSVMAGYSLDGGLNWRRFATLPQPPGTKADDPWRMAFGTIAVAADSIDTIIWLPGFNRSPFYTRDRGRSWHRVVFPGEVLPDTGSFGSIWIQRKTLAADRVEGGTFYLFHGGGVRNQRLAGLWRTQDGGEHWRQLVRGEIAPDSGNAAKLRAVPDHGGHLFFVSGARGGRDTRLRRSTDGGKSWTAMADVTDVDDIAFGKAAKGSAYPALYLSGRVNGAYGIWRSTDAGGHWRRLIDYPLGRLDQVTVMEADKDVFGRVYIGYMGSGWISGEPARCGQDVEGIAGARCTAIGQSADGGTAR